MMGQGEEFAQHGFDLLVKRGEPQKYFDALKERGFFDPTKNSGPVPSANPGFVHIPIWHAVTYLQAVAKRAAETNDDALSEKILQVIRDVSNFRDSKNGEPTDNYQTYFRFADIMGTLPVRCIKPDDLKLIRAWLTSKYDRGMIAYSLAKGLLKNLLANDTEEDIKKACVIVEECMAFEWSSEERRGRSKELVTLVDDYWLKEMLKTYARELGEKAGIDAVSIFEKGLKAIFTDERRSYGSTLWRPAIEKSAQNLDWHGTENRFVEGMRDSLDGWLQTKPVEAAEHVAHALKDQSEIIRRIALNSVTEHFELLREAFENVITPGLFTSGQRHELYRLLNQRFGELSPAGKASVIDAIRKLPPPSTGENPARRLKITQREWLSSIKNHSEAAPWFSQLASDAELGSVSDHPDFLAYHETRLGPGPAPFGADSLIAFAEDGSLVDRLNGFTETDSWKGPTLGGLVAALEKAVATNPNTFLPLLETFHGAKVAFQHALIQGFKRVFDPPNDQKPDCDWNSAWPRLMTFFAKCVGAPDLWEPEEQQQRLDLVPTNGWMRTLIASFLEAGTRDDETAYSPDLLSLGWSIIRTLLDHAPESELSLRDPMTHALNTEKGHVIGAMYNHALRVCRLENDASKSTKKAWASLKDAFDAEIAKCHNANYDFSTLSASYIANLDFMSHEWLADNVVALFPAAAYPNNFKVAIGGLAFGTPTRRLYQLLASKDIFSDALAAKLEDRHGRERIVEWVSLAYLWDDEELDSPIVQKVFSGGADDLEIMTNLFWGARGDKLTDKQKAKIFAFWDRCLSWSKSQTKEPQQLLARLGRLADYIETLDNDAKELLLGTVPYVHNDYATDAMVEELARLVDASPAATAEILERMLEASAPTYDLDDKLKGLIEKLAEHGQRDAAIRCADKVRKTLPGMLGLYKKLTGSLPLDCLASTYRSDFRIQIQGD
jgi:hypothetical protein